MQQQLKHVIQQVTQKLLGTPPPLYLDYAAATPLDHEVQCAMEPYWNVQYGNPSSIHTRGTMAQAAITQARESVAARLNAHADEIIFTGSGTEANNLAILGTVAHVLQKEARTPQSVHCITSTIEHPSVRGCFEHLERKGVQVSYISVDETGRLNLEALQNALQENTVLVSVMMVNNEIGTIEPIAEIAKLIRAHKKEKRNSYPYFHSDASQAANLLPINVLQLHTDLLSLDAQKLYGPKGVGALYKSRMATIQPRSFGGDQEFGLRAATENVPLIVGFAKAFEKSVALQENELARLQKLETLFLEELAKRIPHARVNSTADEQVPSMVNISITGIDNEYMVLLLDAQHIFIGTSTACDQNKDEQSSVLRALGRGEAEIAGSLRFSFGRYTTRHDVRRLVCTMQSLMRNFDTRLKS